MQTNEVFLVIGIVFLIIIYFVYYSKCKKRLKKMTVGVLSGIAVLYPTAYIMSSLGYAMSANLFTLTTAGVLGIPGVILLVVSKLL